MNDEDLERAMPRPVWFVWADGRERQLDLPPGRLWPQWEVAEMPDAVPPEVFTDPAPPEAAPVFIPRRTFKLHRFENPKYGTRFVYIEQGADDRRLARAMALVYPEEDDDE